VPAGVLALALYVLDVMHLKHPSALWHPAITCNVRRTRVAGNAMTIRGIR
jgi:hypothetical protein